MKKFIVIVLGTVLLGNSAFAQKGSWNIGLKTGLKSEICFSSNANRYYKTGQQTSLASFFVEAEYALTDNLFLQSGIGFLRNTTSYRLGTFKWILDTKGSPKLLLYSSLQIPFHVKYTLPLGKSRFNLFFQTGFDLNIPLQKQHSSYHESKPLIAAHQLNSRNFDTIKSQAINSFTSINSPLHKMNLLLNMGMGISYQFPCGIGLFAFAEYYAGIINMSNIEVQYEVLTDYPDGTFNRETEPVQQIVFRGDYWHAGLGVSYTFKRKEKP
jgi:hypothetical protein